MKILLINKYWYPRGGADVYALWLADELKRRGHSVCIFSVAHPQNIVPSDPHVFISGVETEKPNILDAPRTIGRMVWSFEAQRELAAFIERENPDVAHVHNLYTQMSPSVLPVLSKAKIPVVATVHDYGMTSANYSLFDDQGVDHIGSWGSVVRRRGIKRSLVASVIGASVFELHRRLHVYERNITRMIFTTEFARRLFAARGWNGDRGVVIPYVVTLHDEEKKPHQDGGFFLFAGRLHRTKGVHVLIDAARATGLPVKIVGDGPDMEWLRHQAGAMMNVEFLGSLPRPRVLELMRTARAVIVPSVWWEPFGLVALEPQGLGTPVIASNIAGLAEVIVHRQTGIQVEPNDVQQLSQAMRYINDHPEEAMRMGAMGKRRVEALYSIEEHMRKILEVYRVLSRNPSPAKGR